jgi:hypothetical protein
VILYEPFQISARLLPTLKIGNGWLSYDRKTYVFYLDTPEFEYEIHDFRPGCSHGVQDCFEDMMAFFQSAIEEYTYNLREGTEETDEPLFPDHVTKWLVENENAIFDIDYGLWTVPLIKD